jgi:Zn finger protein HypA/HybF involved in hydrogenase expression
MVVTETIAGLSAIKTAFDMTKALKDINDAAIRNAAVIELQEKILSAREAQTALLGRISELEIEVATFEKWEAEKENYQLATIYAETLAYARKPSADSVPHHFICANCYEDRKKRILQRTDAAHVACPECKIRLRFDSEEAKSFNRPIRPRSEGWT